MSMFAIIMLAVTGFFAYQIYQHVQTLEDKKTDVTPVKNSDEPVKLDAWVAFLEEADESFEEGDFERARDKLNRAFALAPQNTEILNKLGFVEGKLGNLDEAIKHYEQSLHLDENDDLTHNALASMYKAQGEFDKAQEHYKKALELDDAYAVTYYNYGNLLVAMNQIPKAKEMYTHALSLDGELEAARTALEELA